MNKVSVIIPVYNTLQVYLEACLKSLLEQTYSNIEILFIDDGSNIATSELLDRYLNCYNNIKVIHKKNEGVAVARNVGIKEASGEWIMFVDSDDWLPSEAISQMMHFENAQIVIGRANFNWKTTCKISDEDFEQIASIKKNEVLKDELVKKILLGKNKSDSFAAIWSKLYNRNFLISNNIFFTPGLKLGEDVLFNIKAYEKSERIFLVNEVVYNYRINSDSVTQKYNIKIIENVEQLLLNFKENISEDFLHKYYAEYNVFIVRQINYIFVKSIFNKQSEIPYNQRINYIRKYIEDDYYYNAIVHVNLKLLSFRKKILAILLKYKLLIFIPFIY